MSEADVGQSMTPEEAQKFSELAASLFASFPELRDDLQPEVKRAAQATHEVTEQLAVGRAVLDTLPEARKPYDDAQAAQASLFNRNVELVIRGLTPLAGMQLAKPDAAMLKTSIPAEQEAAIRELRTMGFGLAMAQFFSSVTLIMLHCSVGSYLDTCEAYLGRKVGSHEVRKRVFPVIKQAAMAAPGVFAPPLISNVVAAVPVVFEAWKQVKASPTEEGKKGELTFAERLKRLFDLSEQATKLSEEMFLAEGIVATSSEALVELRAT